MGKFLDSRGPLEQLLLSRFSKSEVTKWIRAYASPYRELMAYYRCAMMEVETKFKVLSEELALEYDHNPIETIKTRLKEPEKETKHPCSGFCFHFESAYKIT